MDTEGALLEWQAARAGTRGRAVRGDGNEAAVVGGWGLWYLGELSARALKTHWLLFVPFLADMTAQGDGQELENGSQEGTHAGTGNLGT